MEKFNPFPLVTVIMPTYNRADFIVASIHSVISQTYTNWELIIMDDGSDDETASIVQSIRDERIRYYNAGRIGIPGKIKNLALEKAKGDFIAFIDSDDLWFSTKLTQQLAALQNNPAAGFSLTGGYNFKKEGVAEEYFYTEKQGLKTGKFFLPFFRSELTAFAQALLFRRTCLEKTGLFEEDATFSDVDFILNLAFHYDGIILYEPMLYRRVHETNYSSVHWEKGYHQGIHIIRKYRSNKMLPPGNAQHAYFRLYINYGEKCITYKKPVKAVSKFFRAWMYKPRSIVPLKKSIKALTSIF